MPTMNDSLDHQERAMFAQAHAVDVWNDDLFLGWLANANAHAWNRLEDAWQYEGNPASFSWPVLKNAVETYSNKFHASPLATLGCFLFPPGYSHGKEGDWLDWQDNRIKEDIFRTAQD